MLWYIQAVEEGEEIVAIRIRKVKGELVALCAAEYTAEKDDLYLDDNIHYALADKFMKDWKSNGIIK